MTRLEALFSADKLVRDQYAALTGRIAQENSALQTLETRLTDAQGAAARRKDLQTERDDTYGRVFEAIINEQNALAGLYAPLMARLAASSGTLKKLSFSVRTDRRRRSMGLVRRGETPRPAQGRTLLRPRLADRGRDGGAQASVGDAARRPRFRPR